MTDREKAAKKRIKVAIMHLEKARAELDAACSDISSLTGATASFTVIRKLSLDTVEARRVLNYELDGSGPKKPWVLDHDPTPQELHCGHGPKHGCGKGKR